MSNNKTLTAEMIVRDPRAYGLTFVTDPIKTDGKVLHDAAPIVKIIDIDAFRAEIPNADEILTDAMDGSSVRVQAQRVLRDTLASAPTTKDAELKMLVIDRIILRNKAERRAPAPREVPVFIGMDGQKYATAMEARQASIAMLVESGMDVAAATAVTARMTA